MLILSRISSKMKVGQRHRRSSVNACPATCTQAERPTRKRNSHQSRHRIQSSESSRRTALPTSSRLYWTGAVTSMGLSVVGPSHLKETEPCHSHSVAQQSYPAASFATGPISRSDGVLTMRCFAALHPRRCKAPALTPTSIVRQLFDLPGSQYVSASFLVGWTAGVFNTLHEQVTLFHDALIAFLEIPETFSIMILLVGMGPV